MFLRCDVTRLHSVVVMLLTFETFNMGSVLTKLNFFCFYTNVVNFFAIIFVILCLEDFTKFLKLGLKFLSTFKLFLSAIIRRSVQEVGGAHLFGNKRLYIAYNYRIFAIKSTKFYRSNSVDVLIFEIR